jgi:hypothetical protein
MNHVPEREKSNSKKKRNKKCFGSESISARSIVVSKWSQGEITGRDVSPMGKMGKGDN